MNRQILNLAVPFIISNITVPLLGVVDLAIMGHLESEVYIGAIALGGIIFNFLYLGFGFLRMGMSGFTSQSYGERDLHEVIVLLGRGLIVSLAGGLLFIILQKPIDLLSFFILDGSSEVESFAREYFYIRIWAAPAALSVFVFNGWFLGMQNARYPMIITIFINLVNIGLNFFFVYGLGMKSDGVALGTVIAQYSGLLLGVILFLSSGYKRLLKYWLLARLKNIQAFKRFVSVNTDIFIRTLCIIFVLAFFTSVSAKQGDEVLAVNQLLLQFLFIFSYFIDGFANAAEALTGKFFGAKNKGFLRKAVRIAFYWGTALSVPFFILYYLGGETILKIMTDQHDLIGLADDFYFWAALIPITSFAAFIWDGVFIGATASKAMRNTLLVSTLFIFVPAYYFLSSWYGNHGLWLSLNLFMLSRSLLLSFAYRKAVLNRLK